MKEETTRKGTHAKSAKDSKDHKESHGHRDAKEPRTPEANVAAAGSAAAAKIKNRDRKEVQQLIELGKSKGHLTYDEINEARQKGRFRDLMGA